MTLNGGSVKEYSIKPEQPLPPKAVPVIDSHRRNVIDPMTASLVRAPGKDDPLNPDSCKRHMAVFDGRIRYDLDFAYKRMDKVKAEKGYQGPAFVCSVFFSPVAGHVPDRPAVKYMTEMKDMEVWLVPVAGTRVLVPFRFSVPTPLGLGVLEATQFVTDAAAGQGQREDAIASFGAEPLIPATPVIPRDDVP